MEKKDFSRRDFIKVAGGSAAVMVLSGTGCTLLSQNKAEALPRAGYRVFSKGKIGQIQLKNRLVKAATDVGASNDDCTYMKEGFEMYENWSKGGVGLIISGHMTVVPQSREDFLFNHNLTCIHDDKFIPQLSKMAGAVHDGNQDCKIFAQINHIGMDSISNPISASSVPWPFVKKNPRALSLNDIKEIKNLYLAAAKRAKAAGFDGVQLHGAHSFLLNTFLTPFSNKRTDHYGGSMENMVRIVAEITDMIKSSLGSDFPVMIKVNCFDKFPFDGITMENFPELLSALAGTGLDAIEISEDTNNMDETKRQAHWAMFDKRVKLNIPLIMTGGNTSIEEMEKVAQRGSIDYFGLGRPMIKEPNLPSRWLSKIGSDECDCSACNQCIDHLLEGKKMVICYEV